MLDDIVLPNTTAATAATLASAAAIVGDLITVAPSVGTDLSYDDASSAGFVSMSEVDEASAAAAPPVDGAQNLTRRQMLEIGVQGTLDMWRYSVSENHVDRSLRDVDDAVVAPPVDGAQNLTRRQMLEIGVQGTLNMWRYLVSENTY